MRKQLKEEDKHPYKIFTMEELKLIIDYTFFGKEEKKDSTKYPKRKLDL